MPLRLSGSGKKEADKLGKELLERVGLGDRANHKPSELSGGENRSCSGSGSHFQTRLFADEPTGNLDEENAASAIELLLDLTINSGSSILMVDDHGLLSRFDRVLELSQGCCRGIRVDEGALFTYLTAQRLMFHGGTKMSRFIIWISVTGMSLGIATMILVLSVMNGFRELEERLLGLVPHIKFENADDNPEIIDLLDADSAVVSTTKYFEGFASFTILRVRYHLN